MNEALVIDFIGLAIKVINQVTVIVREWGAKNGVSPGEFDKMVETFKSDFTARLQDQANEEKKIFNPQPTPDAGKP